MNSFDDLVKDIQEARRTGEEILKEHGVENPDVGLQNVMPQFWQIEVIVEEIQRLRGILRPVTTDIALAKEALVDINVVPFNKNLKKDSE